MRKHFNPAYRGKKNWEAVVAGIEAGDAIVRDIGEKAFNQLFITTASASYLERRAGEKGVSRPAKTGMADELFRQLAIAVVNQKLGQQAFLRILEVLYGPEAVRGYVESDSVEPFVLDEGSVLALLVDEKQYIEVPIERAEFAIMRRAKADEVAAAITRAFERARSNAYAVGVTDPVTGERRVRVYSGSRGLNSSVRVVAGAAATSFQFPTNVFPKPDVDPTWPEWTITIPETGTLRFAPSLVDFYELQDLEAGDFVVIRGLEFDEDNRGVYEVTAVNFVSGAMWFEVKNPSGVAQVCEQCEWESIQFFSPDRRTPYHSPTYAVVTQQEGGSLVSVAATTQAVNREMYTGAYAQARDAVDISTLTRDPAGLVTVTTATAHDLSAGDWVDIDSFVPTVVAPATTPGTPSGAYSAVNEALGFSDTAQVTHWTTGATFEGVYSRPVRDLDGSLWVIGGLRQNISGILGTITQAAIFSLEDDDTTAARARQYDYAWRRASGTITPVGGAEAVVTATAKLNHILSIGGYTDHPWGVMTAAFYNTTGFRYIKTQYREPVLVANQLSNTQGILPALQFYCISNPVSGDTLVVKNAGATRTYGFGAGGDVTVTIGAGPAATMTNLVTAINGDGSAQWGAVMTTDLEGVGSGSVVILEDAVAGAKSTLRAYGSWTTPTSPHLVVYADALAARPNYTADNGTDIQLPVADPGSGRAGFQRALLSLTDRETHRIRNGMTFQAWNAGGPSWTTSVLHATATATPAADVALADAALSYVGTPTDRGVRTGGSTAINLAVASAGWWNSSTDAWTAFATGLKQARMMHRSVVLDTGKVLVIGGRDPFRTATRATYGFTNWTFEDTPHTAVTMTGPVDVARNANPRRAGKRGHGLQLVGTSTASAGAPQDTLNTLLLGSWTITGWMGGAQGTLLSNAEEPWADEASNTLVAFGVDPADDKFFVRWQHGVGGTTVTEKTTATRTELMPVAYNENYPRYYHFALTKAVSGANATWTLYINGTQVGQWTGTKPSGGADGVWAFAKATTGTSVPIAAVTSTGLDEVGVTSTLLTADDVRRVYKDEVGVAYDNPLGLNISPVGRVLNTCELVDTTAGGEGLTGAMSTARYGFGVCKLPDGRVLVAGGVGYNPSTTAVPDTAARLNELAGAEVYDPSLGIWSPLPDMADAHSFCTCEYIAATNRVYVAGGYTSRRVEYLDLNTMTWHVALEQLPAARPLSAAGQAGSGILVVAGGATPAETFTAITAQVDYNAGVGAETVVSGGINGRHQVATTPGGSSLTLSTPAVPAWTSGTSGELTPVAGVASDVPGPYVFEPRGGFGIAPTTGVLAGRVEQGRRYPVLRLESGDADAFPDEPGYIVLRFGYGNQVGPVKYLGRLSDAELSLDASFVFPYTVEAGAEVTLLVTRAPYVHDDPEEVGAFYLTASNAGLQAVRGLLEEVSASGIDLDLEVRYPGDRGLGAEGAAARSEYRLADKVSVWGGDDLDRELEALRNG